MLPLILGAVALGTVGYGVKKCLTDEDCIDNVKDKIQDAAIKAFEGIESLEDKMGLNEYHIPLKTDKKQVSNSTLQHHFEELYQHKLDMKERLASYHKEFASTIKVRQDKTKDVTITAEMIDNLNSYNSIFTKVCNKIKLGIETHDLDSLLNYQDIVKNLCETKIIKKGKLNDKSTLTINEANKILDTNIENISGKEFVKNIVVEKVA